MEQKERFSNRDVDKLVGTKQYDVEGTDISVAWTTFLPKEITEEYSLTKAVLFIPGWSIPENAASLKQTGQTFADFSGNNAYIVDTTTESVADGSLTQEAKAILKFIEEKGLKNVTLVGNSQGGAEAIHLISLLQSIHPEIQIEGLGLFDPVTLNQQTRRRLFGNYALDILKTSASLMLPQKVKDRKELMSQNMKYTKDGIVGILKGIMHAKGIGWPAKILNEMSEMVTANPDMADVRVPVVIMQGSHDKISNPAETIPNQDASGNEPPYLSGFKNREDYLRKTFFPNSPYVRMIVPEKMGFHNVSFSRPEQSARAVLYTLKRYWRKQPQSQEV